LGGEDEVLDAFSGGGAGAEDRAEAFLGHREEGHDHQAGGGDVDAEAADAGLVAVEQVADRFERDVGGEEEEKETATAFWARDSAVSDRVRVPVNRQITMTEARPSMTEPSAHASREMDWACTPAIRPVIPSALIQISDTQDRVRALLAACCQAGSARCTAGPAAVPLSARCCCAGSG